jgi:hypothetical protein
MPNSGAKMLICTWVKPIFLLACYGCIFHGTRNSAQLCQNFGITWGRGGSAYQTPRYATGVWCMLSAALPHTDPNSEQHVWQPYTASCAEDWNISSAVRPTNVTRAHQTLYVKVMSVRMWRSVCGWTVSRILIKFGIFHTTFYKFVKILFGNCDN